MFLLITVVKNHSENSKGSYVRMYEVCITTIFNGYKFQFIRPVIKIFPTLETISYEIGILCFKLKHIPRMDCCWISFLSVYIMGIVEFQISRPSIATGKSIFHNALVESWKKLKKARITMKHLILKLNMQLWYRRNFFYSML